MTAAASTGEVANATSMGDRSFTLVLPPRNASLKPFGVVLSETGGKSASVSLINLLAGDVWLCSGQSNMEFSVAEMNGAAEVIAAAGTQRGLRLFAVQKNQSVQPLDDIIEAQYRPGWVEASSSTLCGAEYGDASEYCVPHCGPSASVATFKRPTWGCN